MFGFYLTSDLMHSAKSPPFDSCYLVNPSLSKSFWLGISIKTGSFEKLIPSSVDAFWIIPVISFAKSRDLLWYAKAHSPSLS
jgi:hypothetical protein